jgi:hypothetical protein
VGPLPGPDRSRRRQRKGSRGINGPCGSPLVLAASSRECGWMTGFNIHRPPGFVDRAYLVFLVADTLLTELRTTTGLSRSHPLRVRVVGPGPAAGVRAPGRSRRPLREPNRTRGTARAVLGSDNGNATSSHRPPEASGPVPPEEPAPLLHAGQRRPHPYPNFSQSSPHATVTSASRQDLIEFVSAC